MLSNFLHHAAPAIVLQRIFSALATMEHTFVGGSTASLQTPVSDPPIKKCVQDSRVHSWWHNLRQLMQAPVDLTAINARRASDPIGNAAPSLQLMPDTLTGIRGLLAFDGSDNFPLEFDPNVTQILMVHVIEMLMCDAVINCVGIDANPLELVHIIHKIEAIIPLIPRVV